MGVHGLWNLLAPVGRRVSVDTLSGKRLAIDASIWLVQFMKAMRDEKGEMLHNAHLIGFFRRICKLLFLRTKPVFVFDGGTPVLKRRTVIARRRHRENAQAKVRKTAEKLLLNHLKAIKLKQLENDIKNQRKSTVEPKVSKNGSYKMDLVGSEIGRSDLVMDMGDEKEKPGVPMAGEKDQNTCKSSIALGENGSEDEEIILPIDAEVDPVVFAALPPSMQADLVEQRNRKKMEAKVMDHEKLNQQCPNYVKGKRILKDGFGMDTGDPQSYDQAKLDEMLAASIAAEEGRPLVNNMSSLGGICTSEEEEENDDEELILPALQGGVDPAILASLPPSIQLDLLVQMRERLIAENRQKYQKVKKEPTKFSELQIQAYLKAVAFRREIDEVQKTASGRGVGGVQSSRIASEANREFIFSSSFTGDKQQLMTTGVTRDESDNQNSNLSLLDPKINVPSTSDSNPASQIAQDKSTQAFDDSIHTYCDESGRVRVSRLRAMGIRMTRDIQRNLDFMKEIEQETVNVDQNSSGCFDLNARNDVRPSSNNDQSHACSDEEPVELIAEDDGNVPPIVQKENTSIQICFEDDGEDKCFDGDDHFFASLVAGNPVLVSCDNNPLKQSCKSDSDSDWEEGTIAGNSDKFSPYVNKEVKLDGELCNVNDESDVEWEEGVTASPRVSSVFAPETGKAVSKGHIEEEAELQEAIRRSLEDSGSHMLKGAECQLETIKGSISNYTLSQDGRSECLGEMKFNSTVSSRDKTGKSSCGGEDLSHREEINHENSDGSEKMKGEDVNNFILNIDFHELQEKLPIASTSSNMGRMMNNNLSMSPREQSSSGANENSAKEFHQVSGQQLNASNCGILNKGPAVSGEPADTFNEGDGSACHDMSIGTDTNTCSNPWKDERNSAIKCDPSFSTTLTREDVVERNIQQSVASGSQVTSCNTIDDNICKDAIGVQQNLVEEFHGASLEEEMLILDQERFNLGTEQKKFERDAESVNNELFTECQELLQMFGLPYIIAPMEAEAQCAYLEQAKLVDGVVTDDSDVFLFGARNVYKNIFDDRKYVETYFMEDIEKELGLTREQLIRVAMLLGSDYTEGISGIGIVNAIEVVNAFPEEDGLLKFREWVESPDPTILGKFDTRSGSSSWQRGSKVDDNVNSDQEVAEAQTYIQTASDRQEMKQTFMDKHRNVSKNWHIPPSFPSEAVISAYSSPQVDKSTELFTWAKPDHLVLRKFCWEKFGWTRQKTDELLIPVLEEYNKRETQLRLEAFYTFNERFAKIRSKRIKKAVKGITGNQSSELIIDAVQETSSTTKNIRLTPDEFGEKFGTSKGTGKNVKVQTSRKRKSIDSGKKVKDVSSSQLDIQAGSHAEEQRFRRQCLRGNRKGGSRGNGGSRGRGFQKKGLGGAVNELCHNTSSEGSETDRVSDEVQVQQQKGSELVRRSTRSRKPVVYSINDLESDDTDNSSELKAKSLSEVDKQESQDLFQAEATCLVSDHLHSTDIALGKDLLRNCPEVGVRFHDEEGQIDRDGEESRSKPSLERDSTFNYLKTGGGFCVDDGNEGHDNGRADSPSIAEVEGSAVLSPNVADEADGSKLHDMQSNFNFLNPANSSPEDTDNVGKNLSGALRVMPNLRRKRRKT